jgi:drug/metabolite transporter (DMT)-like permease
MPLTALLMVLAAAVLHASWNIVAKRAGGNHHFACLTSVFIALLWLPVALWFGVQELGQWSPRAWACVGLSAVLHLLYFNTLLTGYRVADLTVVYPVARGSGPLVSVLGAMLLLGEKPSLLTLAGVATVCGGVFLIAGGPALWRLLSRNNTFNEHDSAQARTRLLAGLRWGALTGLLIAGYTVVDAYAVKVLLVGPVLLDYMGNLLRLPVLMSASLHQRSAFKAALRSQWRAALLVAFISPAGYVLVLYALKIAPLSQVAPAREMSMLFAALLGGRLLAEGDRVARIAGAACIALGVAALARG